MSTQINYLNDLLFSALILASAFFFPSYFFIGALFFCVPLFTRIIQTNDLAWYHGFLWGAIFFSLHWFFLIPLLYYKAYGAGRLLWYPLFVVYASSWTAAWFFFMTFFTTQKKSWAIVFVTWFYFLMWEQHGFFFIDKNLRYCFGSPLLPLISTVGWKAIVHYGNIHFLLLLILFMQYYVAVLLTKKIINRAQLGLFIFFIWFVLFFSHYFQNFFIYKESKRDYHHIVHIKPLTQESCDYWSCAEQLSIKFTQALRSNKQCTLLIMPESSFPFALNRHVDVIDLWTERALKDKVELVIGAHRQEGRHLFNSMYSIRKGAIVHTYDKKKLVPCVEYIPLNTYMQKSTQNLFLHRSRPFSPANASTQSIFFCNDQVVLPQICFDFFYTIFDKKNNQQVLLVLLNERWFFFDYIKDLLFLYACFISSYLQITIYYVGAAAAYVIKPLYSIRLSSQ